MPHTDKKGKVVLAYSGGLDTSVILKWLCLRGFDVICFIGNVGQREDFSAVEEKAYATGASKAYCVDLQEKFVTDFIFPAMQGNALYEGRYLLGTSLARPLLAEAQIEIAKKERAMFVSHGATGKGNDQVRFELSYYALHPSIHVISPWKDEEFLSQFKGRSDMIAYAYTHGIPVKASQSKPYSEDENLMHISHEAGILEDIAYQAGEEVYSLTASPRTAPDEETLLSITFHDGIPVQVENKNTKEVYQDPLSIFTYLNAVGKTNAIGRLDMVENRFIGIKSRGMYETPGATILWTAHRDLEGVAMDKEVMHLRDRIALQYSDLIYNGFWFSPEMEIIKTCIEQSQKGVSGTVWISLYKGNCMAVGRESEHSLYNQKLSSMDEEGGFNAADSRGFINIHALRLKTYYTKR